MLDLGIKIEIKIHEVNEFLCTNTLWSSNKTGLVDGLSGACLFLANYYECTHEQRSAEVCKSYLLNIFQSYEEGIKSLSYAEGLCGIYTTLFNISRTGVITLDEFSSSLEICDSILEKHMFDLLEKKNLDFLYGAIGIGMYFLERKNSSILNQLIQAISAFGIQNKSDKTFKWLYLRQGHWIHDLGMAHGISSLITFASLLKKERLIADENLLQNLVHGAVNFLLSSEVQDQISLFPDYVTVDGKNNSRSRLSWCYGDLGIACALWNAGTTFNNQDWIDKSISIIEFNTKRVNLTKNGVEDISFCHGASGIAHIFYKFYGRTKQASFKEAYYFWYEKALELIENDATSIFKNSNNQKSDLLSKCDLLNGISGVGLSFLNIYNNRQDWDRALLIS